MDAITRFDASQGPRILHPRDGLQVSLGGCGVRFMIWGEESGGGFSLVEHPIPPRHLAAPVHRHHDEDPALSWQIHTPFYHATGPLRK